jgi:hypothetical protein
MNNRTENPSIGDGPIEERYRLQMRAVAETIDEFLNPDGNRRCGFIVLMFDFGGEPGARCNYISNADRADVVTLLREQLARFEGMPTATGRA